MAQHTTPCTASSRSPAELLIGWKLTSLLDQLHPNCTVDQQPSAGTKKVPRSFFPGDPVYAQKHGSGLMWVLARVMWVTGPVSCEISTKGGLIWHCHIDQLSRRVLSNMKNLNPNSAAPKLESSPPKEQSTPCISQSQEEEVCPADDGDTEAPVRVETLALSTDPCK